LNPAPKKRNRWRRIVRILLLGLACVLAGAVAVYLWSKSAPLTERQREALELFRNQQPYSGRNAFDAMWLLDRDTPTDEADLRAITEADMRSHTEWWRDRLDENNIEKDGPLWTAPSDSKYANLLAPQESDPPWCKPLEWGKCLQQVRADPLTYAQLLERHEALSTRIDALAQYARYENEFPPGAARPLPRFQILLTLPLTREAQAIAQDDAVSALAIGCRNLQLGTMLATRSRDLLSGTVGARLIASQVQALAWILATYPAQAIPESCVSATAALTPDDFDLCPHLHAEWEDHLAMFPPGGVKGTSRLVLDAGKTSARLADAYAESCRAPAREQLLQDLPVDDPPSVSAGLLSRECLANSVGCMLSDIARPTFAGYQHRLQDAWAVRQALRSLIWLHAQAQTATLLKDGDGAGLIERLGERPQDMKTPARRTAITAQPDGSLVLGVPLYDQTLRKQLGQDALQLPLTVVGD